MARYKLKSDAFLNGQRHRKGEIIDYDGTPAKAMEPVDKAVSKTVTVSKVSVKVPAKASK